MNDTCIYTVITNNYDNLKGHNPHIRRGIDFICFTDDPQLKHKDWRIIFMEESLQDNYNPKIAQRKIKILGHPALKKYKHVAYIDGSVRLIRQMKKFIQKNSDKPTFFRNPNYHNSITAAAAIIKKKKAKKGEQEKQIKELIENYGEEVLNSQCWTGLMIRDRDNNSPIWSKWWELFKKYPYRDQIPLPAALHNEDYRLLPNSEMMKHVMLIRHNEKNRIYYK